MKQTRLYLIVFVIVISCASFKSTTKDIPENRNLDVFLLIGQSNMAGVAKIGVLDTVELQNAYLFNDKNEWEKARNLIGNGMNRYSTVRTKPTQRFSPAYTFARTLADYTNRPIGIVSNAKGGTGIVQWQKGYNGELDFNLYEEALARAKAALAAAPGSKLKGILWHQGEGDQSAEKSAAYLGRLRTLIGDFREDLGDSSIAVIAGEIGQWKGRGELLNPKIREIVSVIPHSDWVSSAGLNSINLEKNDAHFDTYSQRVLGVRYAEKVLKLVYGMSAGNVTVFTGTNYQGRSITLRDGQYTSRDLEAMGIGKGEIASLKISAKSKVQLFPQESGRKPFQTSRNVVDLSASRFSSLKIRSRK
ncbi:MAG TPA: sialate O-acetylesterase [Sphingobacteriaceae bacterium]